MHAATMVHQLQAQAERLRDRPALWTRRSQTWQPTSWRQFASRVKDVALGLQALGVAAGARVLLSSRSREEWVLADLAIMACGAVTVPVDPSLSEASLVALAARARVQVALVESERHLRALGEAAHELPELRLVVAFDVADDEAGVRSWAALLDHGARGDDADYYARLAAITPEAPATLAWVPRSAEPLAAVLTHHNLVWTASQLAYAQPATPDDVLLAFQPLWFIGERVGSSYAPLFTGAQVFFAQPGEAVVEELLEVRPTLLSAVPAVWDTLRETLEAVLKAESRPRRLLLEKARASALRQHTETLQHQQAPVATQVRYAAARRLLFPAVKASVGIERVRRFTSRGAPLSRALFDFFASLDVVVADLYGQTETAGFTALNVSGALRPGTVGRPLLGVEVRVVDGEVQVRGGNVFSGYFEDAEATGRRLDGGWLRSGDEGRLDEDGYLTISRPAARW